MSESSWKPGDPDRRRSRRSLLELTGTTVEDHLPAGGHEPEVSAHGHWVVDTHVPERSLWRTLLRRLRRDDSG